MLLDANKNREIDLTAKHWFFSPLKVQEKSFFIVFVCICLILFSQQQNIFNLFNICSAFRNTHLSV